MRRVRDLVSRFWRNLLPSFSCRDWTVVRWSLSLVAILIALVVGTNYLILRSVEGVFWMGSLLLWGCIFHATARKDLRRH